MAVIAGTRLIEYLQGYGVVLGTGMTTAWIQNRLDAAQSMLERETGRQFAAETEQRFFDGTGQPRMAIDDCTAVTAVALFSGGTSVTTYTVDTDYVLEPLNFMPKQFLVRSQPARGNIATVIGGAGNPLREYIWPEGVSNIAVTGTWQSGELSNLPPDWVECLLMQAALLLLSGTQIPSMAGNVAGAVRSYSTGAFSVTFGGEADLIGMLTGWQDELKRIKGLFTRWRVT